MKLKLRDINAPEPLSTMRYHKVLSVSEETHDRVKEVADRTGYTLKDMGEVLVKFALDNIEWEGKDEEA